MIKYFMNEFNYIVSYGNKQYAVKRNCPFLVDKITNCKDGENFDIVCLLKDDKICPKGQTIGATVVNSYVNDKVKRRSCKRKARSHHSRGIKGFRPKHTMLVIGDSQ